jgi:uncharacterized membrane protein
MMYAGALYYLIGGSLSLAITLFCLALQLILRDVDHRNPVTVKIIKYIAVIFLLVTTFLGSWLFWGGFVQLAGELLVLFCFC